MNPLNPSYAAIPAVRPNPTGPKNLPAPFANLPKFPNLPGPGLGLGPVLGPALGLLLGKSTSGMIEPNPPPNPPDGLPEIIFSSAKISFKTCNCSAAGSFTSIPDIVLGASFVIIG